MTQRVQTSKRGSVFEIRLCRPDKRNAVDFEMWQQLDAAILEVVSSEGIRLVQLSGEGKAFCAGIDLASFLNLPERYGADWQQRMRRITEDFQGVLTRLERLEIPTVALLHGHCLGLGMELALACDLRFAEANTQMALPETLLGLVPDVGGTTRLTRMVGPARSKEMIFTGRRIDAQTALLWGVVNVVTDDLEAAAAKLLDDLAQTAPLAVGMAKRVIDGSADLDRGLQLESWAQSQLIQSQDFQEAIEAFLQKRKPKYQGK